MCGVNGARISVASRAVKPGDVLTVALDRTVRVLKVAAFAERRGDAQAGRLLYEDLSPPPVRAVEREPEPPPALLAAAARRARAPPIDRFTGEQEG